MIERIIAGAVLGGAGCALAGHLLVNLRLPFLAVCLSHAAMAGAIMGHLLGIPILLPAFVASMIAAILLGPLSDLTGADVNVVAAILFALSLGLAFLGIGLVPGPKSEVLNLLWGSVLLVRARDLAWMAAALLTTILFLLLFYKEIKAIQFDRRLAILSGIHGHMLYYVLLMVAGGVITVNLHAIGGLMLFSLLVNPAAATMQFRLRFGPSLALSTALGVVSALAGLAASFWLDWPAGASILVASSLIFIASVTVAGARARLRPAE